jgi:hypothetical protein
MSAADLGAQAKAVATAATLINQRAPMAAKLTRVSRIARVSSRGQRLSQADDTMSKIAQLSPSFEA